MRKALGGLALALLALSLFGASLLAAPRTVITRWESAGAAARLELEARASVAGDTLGFVVALPERGGWRLESLRVDGRRFDGGRHVRLGEPGRYRRQRIGRLALMLPPELDWRRAELRLAFDAALPPVAARTDDPLLDGLLVNPPAAAAAGERAGSRAGSDFFDGSGRWIRVDVSRSGVHRLDYDGLVAAGVPPGTAVAGFRLLGSGGRGQPFRMGGGGSWSEDWEPTEVPLLVRGGDQLGPDSELLAFLPGVDGWADDYEAGAEFDAYRRNRYAGWATYYLTWGGADGQRIAAASAAPVGGETPIDHALGRVHGEENYHYEPRYEYEDGWAWHKFNTFDSAGPQTHSETAALGYAAAGAEATLRVGYDAPQLGDPGYGPHYVRGYLSPGGSTDPDFQFFAESFYLSSSLAMKVLEGSMPLPAALAGVTSPQFVIELPRDGVLGMEEDYGWLLWFEVYFGAELRSVSSTPLELHIPPEQPRAELAVSGWDHEPEVWDLSDPDAPLFLTGGLWAGDSLRVAVDTPSRRRLLFVDPESPAGYRSPERLLAVNPTPLRNDAVNPDLIVVTFDGKLDDPGDRGFLDAGARYADWRREHFPVTGSGAVEVTGIGDIYANFGSGMQDLAALRNFLKYRYEAPGSRLSYVLLLGDTTTDYRNFNGGLVRGDVSNVLVPALSDRSLSEHASFFYTTDDYFCYMDAEDDSLEIAVPDLAVGRLPAPDLATAEQMVDMVIGYERDSAPGAWRNRLVLATDDYTRQCNDEDSIDHTSQAENLVREALPAEFDLTKIYMCEWDCDYSGFKPQAQNALFAALQEGVLIFNYVGHGGNDVLSDEQLLLTSRLPSLQNADRRFLFVSASCNVGKFDDTLGRSMSEEMLSLAQGGAIGTMASSALSSAGFNNVLNTNFLQELFPTRTAVVGAPIGAALLRAKVRIQQENYSYGQGSNNERYTILGDPTLRLHGSELAVDFAAGRADSLEVGASLTVAGRILRDGLLAPDFNGTLYLSVRASADTSGFVRPGGAHVDYHLQGPEIYRGRIEVHDGRFEAPAFFVPGLPDSALGRYGRIRAYAIEAHDGVAAVGVLDSLAVLPGLLPADDTPPAVALRLAGGATHATPGMDVEVMASSDAGINLVGELPQNAIFVEYVEAGEIQNLTDEFEYDVGSATSGRAEGSLPAALPEGDNTLVASVADNLGNVGRDTLRVRVFEAGRSDLAAVQPFPNPFRERCVFSFELTAPASVQCDVYTVSGRRIRRLEGSFASAGRGALEWDGRDDLGEQVANGTYLYRLEATYDDNAARRRERTGAVVRMRD